MIRWLLALLLAAIAAWLHGNHHGHQAEATEWSARIEHERATAAEQARTTEHQQQGRVNHALQQQIDDLAGINARLLTDLDRLRRRPERPASLPETAGVDCQSATGAELSREDAEFLAREAARADQLRAALTACYTYADAITSRPRDSP